MYLTEHEPQKAEERVVSPRNDFVKIYLRWCLSNHVTTVILCPHQPGPKEDEQNVAWVLQDKLCWWDPTAGHRRQLPAPVLPLVSRPQTSATLPCEWMWCEGNTRFQHHPFKLPILNMYTMCVYFSILFRSLYLRPFAPRRLPTLSFSLGKAVPPSWLTSCLWTFWSRPTSW